jgi:hypothetical protein
MKNKSWFGVRVKRDSLREYAEADELKSEKKTSLLISISIMILT